MSEALCPVGHDKDKRTADGLNVCLWHRDRAERAVAELPALYDALERRLVASGAGGLTGMPAAKKDPGIDLNHRVVACRTNIKANLVGWARFAIEERGMHCPPDNVYALSAFIVRQVDWFLAGPGAKQFANDVIDDWGTARSLSEPNPTRRFEVGPCVEPECEGILVAYIRPLDSLLPSHVICDSSPEDEEGTLTHMWPADKWMLLGRRVMAKGTA